MLPTTRTNKTNFKPRYSNFDPATLGAAASAASESGIFQFLDSIGGKFFTSAENVAVAIWGKGDKYKAQALELINKQQEKNTKILWAVVGCMAVVGAIILIRKTN